MLDVHRSWSILLATMVKIVPGVQQIEISALTRRSQGESKSRVKDIRRKADNARSAIFGEYSKRSKSYRSQV